MPLLALLMQMPVADNKSQNVLHLLFSSDPVVKFTLFILVLFSVFSWAIIFFKARQINKAKKGSRQFLHAFETSYTLDEVLAKNPAREGNPLSDIFASGLSDLLRYRQASGKDPRAPKPHLETIKRVIFRRASDEIASLEQLTPFLATTASSCPFIGLFGTVWGILTAFWAIGKAGSTSLATVGPYIAEALIATAVGLAAAIPAVIAYNFFVSKIKVLDKTIEDFSSDLYHRIEKEYF